MNKLLSLNGTPQLNIGLAYAFIRIFVGVALLVRGIILFTDPSFLTKITGANQWYWWYSYVVVIHIIGGFLLSIGYLTRFSALIQIPILVGAIFVYHLKRGLGQVEQSLELSTLVLVLLIIFFIFGSGNISIDEYLEIKKSKTIKKE